MTSTRKVTRQDQLSLMNRGRKDPAWFVRFAFGVDPWPVQVNILESVRDYPRTAVRSCHGIGKSFTAALSILWFLYTFRYSIVLSTAPTWRQVEKLIWKELRAAFSRSRVPLGGTLLPKSPELQIVQDQWAALGISTDKPDRFQGFHSRYVLVVVDEAAGVSDDIFEAVEGVLTSQHCRLLLLGNPTRIGGQFYRAFGPQSRGWHSFKVSAFDTPNFTHFGISEQEIIDGTWQSKVAGQTMPYPRLIVPSWAAEMYQKWGPKSPAYQSRVLGDFPSSGDNSVIPLDWVEQGFKRWEGSQPGEPVVLGCDIAAGGSAMSVITALAGKKVLFQDSFSEIDVMVVAGRIVRAFDEVGADAIHVDPIGVGLGVYNRLAELEMPVKGINVSHRARDSEHFFNLRSELWWNVREALDPNSEKNPRPVSMPYGDDLLSDLASPIFKLSSKGQIQLERKEETMARLGRSPDHADSLVMALAPTVRPLVVALGSAEGPSRWRGRA